MENTKDLNSKPVAKPNAFRIALVHDDFMQWGGAERVMAVVAEQFSDAPMYTLMADERVLSQAHISPDRVVTSWLDRLPGKKMLNKVLFPFYQTAFEQFDFSNFDLVFSTSTRFAHGIITKPTTKHIAYIHSPFRGFWDPRMYFDHQRFGNVFRIGLSPLLSRMRLSDFIAGQRPDELYGNSSVVVQRIKKYYRRHANLLFPFVDINRFTDEKAPLFQLPEKYMVVMSRLVEWKRIDLAIEACRELKIPLVVIGTGSAFEKLRSLGNEHTIMAGYLSDNEASYVLRRSVALIHPQYEDFGMTIVEAHACGIPVVAYNKGGAQDTVVSNVTGVLFEEQTVDSLKRALVSVETQNWQKDTLVEHAQMFSKELFIERIKTLCYET